jgi:subtilisin family serine protease
MKRAWLAVLVAVIAGASFAAAPAGSRVVGISVVLNTPVTGDILSRLGAFGKVRDVVTQINGVTMQAAEDQLAAIRTLPFVAVADIDQPRAAIPVRMLAATDFLDGVNTWNLDAIDVTDFGVGRVTPYAGEGVYVAVLDTGLLSSWPTYFPADRIDTVHARAFGGGGGDVGWVSEQPNKWQQDQDSHGTHVTSTIIGYQFGALPVNGVAPLATIVPVKVLNQNGSGWSSVIARGIVYIADLKAGDLAGHPVVINMSLGGSRLDPLEKAAIDYAISEGVIVVASAGNLGTAGMGFPGAYAPVISAAASGWVDEWSTGSWWLTLDVQDPTNPADFYIADFSSREKPGQDLDVAAPGSWVLGPYQVNGQISYYYLGGTSMASPHVAGIVALMAEKDPSLTAPEAEAALEASAIDLGPGCRSVLNGFSPTPVEICWGADATGAGLVTALGALSDTSSAKATGRRR